MVQARIYLICPLVLFCIVTTLRAEDGPSLDAVLSLMESAGNNTEPSGSTQAPAIPPAEDAGEALEKAGIVEQPQKQPPRPRSPDHLLKGSRRSLEVSFIEPGDSSREVSDKGMPPAQIMVDGRLDDPVWEKASSSGSFWCSLENRPPSDPTEILTASDDNYLYFGIRLYDSQPDDIQATKTVRDTGLGYDDSITVQLDPFFNRRDINEFSLNPLGTQSDEFAGGRASKITWKGDWFGAAVKTDYGWSAEFAIPYGILNYNPGDTVFGINFKRYQSRTKEYSYWSDVTPRGLNEEMGQLTGLSLPDASEQKSWTFMPFVLIGRDVPDKEGDIQDTLITGGIDIRYEPRSDLTGVISLNPDFSQVEQDVTDISFSYTEKALPDNRPFFSEGSRYFADEDDDNEYFYSNRAADFDYGAKSFGRFGQTKFGLLGTSAPNSRNDFAGRALYELDDTHSAIIASTATRQEDFDNVLGLIQLRGREDSGLTYALDAAGSDTSGIEETDPLSGGGSHVQGELGWRGDYWYLKGNGDYYNQSYFPALALLEEDLPGTRAAGASTGYYRELSSFCRVVNGYTGYEYRETLGEELQRRKWYAGGSVEFENQINVSGFVEEGPYRPVTDVRGEFEDYTNNDRYYSLAMDLNTRSSFCSAGAQYDWGYLGGGDYQYGSVYGWVRPIQAVYLKLSYEITDYYGVSEQTILNGSWDITPENSIGARYIYEDDDGNTDEYIRFAYGHKARKGLDIFLVYDKNPYEAEQYSLKLVYSF